MESCAHGATYRMHVVLGTRLGELSGPSGRPRGARVEWTMHRVCVGGGVDTGRPGSWVTPITNAGRWTAARKSSCQRGEHGNMNERIAQQFIDFRTGREEQQHTTPIRLSKP